MSTSNHEKCNASRASEDDPAHVHLRKLSTLAPLPPRSKDLVRLLCNRHLDTPLLIEIIERNPALATWIKGVATSPFVPSGSPPSNLSDAIVRLLGPDLTRALSLSLVLSQPFQVRGCARFDPLRYWKHAMMTASFAQTLARTVRADPALDASTAYHAGLLHNLGMLALVNVAPQEMDDVFMLAQAHPDRSLRTIARDVIGLDQAAAGGAVAAAWDLPAPISATLLHHGDAGYRGSQWQLVALVTLADRVRRQQTRAGLATDCPDDLLPLARALGADVESWRRAVELWQPQIRHVDQLAEVLAGRAS